jgi:putative hemolysin
MRGSVEFSYAHPTDPTFRRLAIRGLERLTGQPKLRRLYEDFRCRPMPDEDFFTAGIRLLDLRLDHEPGDLDKIPATGPLVVVANHPFGVVDGCVLAGLVGQRRPDYRVVAHGLLARAPEAAARILPIDFSTRPDAASRNVAVRRAAIDWLKQGHVILVFPAGAVSTTQHGFARHAVDERWKPFTSRLVQAAAAPVLPVRFSGQNSRLFQVVSQFSPTLRTGLFFNEVQNKIGATIGVTIGDLVPYAAIAHLRDRQAMADHLRARTYALPERRHLN